MAVWARYGDGRAVKPGDVVAPDQRLSWPRTVSMGLQHVMAMFGATFLVPVITGFPPSTTLFFSAIGTGLFLLLTGNRLPSYLGSSFAFLAPIGAATGGSEQVLADPARMGTALFGVLCTGLLLAAFGLLIQAVGSAWLEAFMPPVMTGTIVMLIGFNLAGPALNNLKAGPVSAWATIVAVVVITVLFRGLLGRLSILLGVLVGYGVAAVLGQVSYTSVGDAGWVGLPAFHTPTVDFSILPMFLPVVLVLVAENVGHVKSVALMTGRNYDKSIGRALLADGLATTLAGFGGGSGTTTYAENIGVMAATKVYSTAVYWVAAGTALVLSLVPKFGAAINTVPAGVLGGAGIVLYGMIGLLGARIWIENKVDFANPVNLFPAAVGLIIAIADPVLMLGDVTLGPIAVGTVAALVLFHAMRYLGRWRGTDTAG